MSENKNHLRIIRLEASNVKRLKAVEIVPNGNSITISGRNDQGKSSLLDSIEYALGGKDSICERPIRDGASKARIVCDLGDIVVERNFSAAGGTTLSVKTKDGVPIKSPQAVLDSLCSHIAFDPLSFTKMDSKKQLETLRALVGLDFTKLDAERAKHYADRTMENRELENAKGKLAGFPFDTSAPGETVAVGDLMVKLEEVQKINTCNATFRRAIVDAQAKLTEKREKLAAIGEVILGLEQMLAKRRAEYDVAKGEVEDGEYSLKVCSQKCDSLTDADESPIREQIKSLDETNTKVRANKRHLEIKALIKEKSDRVEKLGELIEGIDNKKREMLSEAKFPLPGLSFDESGVLLNGVPFRQGSQARQLQAAVAIGIALNPKVRVIIIRDASLLDDDSLALVKEMADTNDVQIWLEVVNSDDTSAIIIEDGSVKE